MACTTIDLGSTPAAEAAQTARRVLAEGGIVAFPTETVWGLAIRGGDQAVNDRLFALKGRAPEKHLARYVAGMNQLAGTAARGLRARRLARAFWPGPLTLVAEATDGSTHGFRCSSHPVAALLGSDDGLEVYGTSANLSGEPPLASGAAIREAFGDGIDLILDQDTQLSGRASTVVLLPRGGGFTVLRAGEVSAEMISHELTMKIVFVCTGNTCRSPLAAAMFRDMLEKRGLSPDGSEDIKVFSAGTSAGRGAPASENSQLVASERGLDLSAHASRPAETELLESADLVLTMTGAHRDLLAAVLPACDNRIRTLAPDGRDIVDPFGAGPDVYRACAEDIEKQLAELMEEL